MGASEAACHFDSDLSRSSGVGEAQESLKGEEMNVIEERECRRV